METMSLLNRLVSTSGRFTYRFNLLIFSVKLERAKGFEPSTPTLARLCSTPELRPLERLRSAAWKPQDRGEAGG